MTGPAVAGGGLWHRTVGTVTAQVLSSASNAVVQLGLVVTANTAEFGAFVVALAVWFLALFLGRAWVGDPLVALSTRGSGPAETGEWPGVRRRLLRLGAGAGAAITVWAFAPPAATVRSELILLAVCTPLLLVQDGYRYRFWAWRRPGAVVVIDGIWVVGAVAGPLLALSAGPGDGVAAVLGAWLAGGVASLLAARHLARSTCSSIGATNVRIETVGHAAETGRPVGTSRAAGIGRVAKTDRTVETGQAEGCDGNGAAGRVRALQISQVVLAVESSLLPLAVSAGAGTAVAAGLRAAVLPFLPVTTVTGALRLVHLPDLRAGAEGGTLRAATVRAVVAAAAAAASLGIAGLALVLLVPAGWLGPTGQAVRPWYWLAVAVVGARSVTVALADALALSAPAARTAGFRLATSALDWAGGLGGALVAGVPGALAGRALAGGAGIVVWSAALVGGRLIHCRSPEPRRERVEDRSGSSDAPVDGAAGGAAGPRKRGGEPGSSGRAEPMTRA